MNAGLTRRDVLIKTVTTQLSGWGNWRPQPCHVARPQSHDELAGCLDGSAQPSWISRGLGRSYGDAAVNGDGGVLLHDHRQRILAFSPENRTIECEAGVSLGEIMRTALPHGLFLPVTPGTKFVTLGGAIAADVHGKNHHRDGNLSNFLLDFELMLADGGRVVCSRQQNAELFWATLGGMGLTGIILSGRLELLPIESAYVATEYRRTANLDELLDQFDDSDRTARYSVAWIDGLARGADLGRAVLILGNHAARDELQPAQRSAPLDLPVRRAWSVPNYAPGWLLRRSTLRAFNAWTYRRYTPGHALLDFDRYFYPLDRLGHWNRLYGRRGFVEYQAVLPQATARGALVKLLERIHASEHPPFLAGLKATGQQSQAPLAFLEPGYTIGMDFPARPGLVEMLHDLDRLVLEAGGRLYLAKDATMRPETFAASYPRLNEFRQLKARIDPERRFSSSLARRLKMVD